MISALSGTLGQVMQKIGADYSLLSTNSSCVFQHKKWSADLFDGGAVQDPNEHLSKFYEIFQCLSISLSFDPQLKSIEYKKINI